MDRYRAKAAERGECVATVRNLVRRYQDDRVLGLVDKRWRPSSSMFHACDSRWLEVAKDFLESRTLEATVSRTTALRMIRARFRELYNGSLPEPGRTSAFRALKELDGDRGDFDNAKAVQNKAAVPSESFGHFHATRPGQYVILDTHTFDMQILDPITLAPCRLEVTAAMDLYSRCILALRIATESTKSIDVASVLFEIIHPRQAPAEWPEGATWPYHGVPEAVLQIEHETPDIRFSGPGLMPDAIVVDHGKIFISDHIMRACGDLGFSVFPARKYTPTDKSPLERWFETLETFLQLLPGYTGKNPLEAPAVREAYFLPTDLDRFLRALTALVYHQAPMSSEADDETPGLHLSPYDRYTQGIAAAGYILLPRDPTFVFHLLPEERRAITHGGVSIDGLTYRAPILGKYRGHKTSDHNAKRKWSFRVNPDDLRAIYFQDPEDDTWHAIPWERSSPATRPFNAQALAVAKAYANEKYTSVEDELLRLAREFGAGLELSPKERKAAWRALAQDAKLRAALQRATSFTDPPEPEEPQGVSDTQPSSRGPGGTPKLAVDEADYYSETEDLL
jgi:transposase InsO family protein